MSKKTEYKIFISWSGEHGKTIAKKLQQIGIEIIGISETFCIFAPSK